VDKETTKLMEAIDKVYLDHPYYGSRKMAKELRKQGWNIGRKKTRSLMIPMGIQAIYQRTKRKPNTSKGNPEHKIYKYLLRDLEINRPNQVWCTDITYIPLDGGWISWPSWIGTVGE
jgi:putative transposase